MWRTRRSAFAMRSASMSIACCSSLSAKRSIPSRTNMARSAPAAPPPAGPAATEPRESRGPEGLSAPSS
eukprot:11725202-Alexandrium_andersonii.AAC.1